MDLSGRRIETLTAVGRYRDTGRGAVRGLAFQVSRKRGRSWVFRYKFRGIDRMLGLGELTKVNLAEARRRAKDAGAMIYAGIDPIAARRQKKQTSMTFREAAEAYVKAHEPGWKNAKHRDQWHSTLKTYAYPAIGDLSVADIDIGDVRKVIEPIWYDRTETGKRLRGRLEQVLDYAKTIGARRGDNPARWLGNLKMILPAPSKIAKRRHHPSLPYARMPEFIQHLSTRDGLSARALEFTILCANRTSEVIGAKWDEVDLGNRLWVIPAERMKGTLEHGREHRVPLTPQAIKLLRGLPTRDDNDFLFLGPGTGGLSDNALGQVIKRMNKENEAEGRPRYLDPKQDNRPVVPHGFRSSFKDWARERTTFPNEVSEAALAHISGDKVERAYARSDLFDKRRKLLEMWAAFCLSPTQRKSGKSVVPFREAVG